MEEKKIIYSLNEFEKNYFPKSTKKALQNEKINYNTDQGIGLMQCVLDGIKEDL